MIVSLSALAGARVAADRRREHERRQRLAPLHVLSRVAAGDAKTDGCGPSPVRFAGCAR